MKATLDLQNRFFEVKSDAGELLYKTLFDMYEISNLGLFIHLYHTVTFEEGGRKLTISTATTIDLEDVEIIGKEEC